MIGVYLQESDAASMVRAIRAAEAAGVPACWLSGGGTNPDLSMVFAAAAMVTDKIKFGTSIIQTWPRHPVALAQQALTLASLAPGRFRLGIGPGHKSIEQTLGVKYERPLLQLREYITVLTELLHKGEVSFAGSFVRTEAKIAGAVSVPVMASALRPASFRLAGEIADGAISWMAPWEYLRDVALPALQDGAESVGRKRPPAIVHVPILLGANRDEMLERSRAALGVYSRVPNYQAMMRTAGFADSVDSRESKSRKPVTSKIDPFLEALVVWGSETQIIDKLRRLLAEGADEIIVHPLFEDKGHSSEQQRVFELVSEANHGDAGVL